MRIKKKDTNSTYIFGVHAIIEAIKAKRRKILTLYTTNPRPKIWSRIAPIILQQTIPVRTVTRTVLAKLAGTADHQGLVGLTTPFPFQKVFFDPKKTPVIALIDGVQDERNLGAILRSAYCTGIEGVILTTKQSALYTPVACKASAGLSEYLKLYQVPTAQAVIPLLKRAGYRLYLTTLDGMNVTKITFKAPLCIVIGGEGYGISKAIINEGIKVTLPQKTSDISYNASVAAGIIFFIVANYGAD